MKKIGFKILVFVNTILHKLGIEIAMYPDKNTRRRIQFLKDYKINRLIDVGANKGQYALDMRKLGYKGDIISFEPLSKAFNYLKKSAQNDKAWKVFKCALGDENTQKQINISMNTDSSSLNNMLEIHSTAAPDSKYVGTETVVVKTLDSIFSDFYEKGDNIYLKIDTQGYEKNVLNGASSSLNKIKLIQIEMSLTLLYEGSMLIFETINYLKRRNFELVGIENGFAHPKSKRLLQVDGIFVKTNN